MSSVLLLTYVALVVVLSLHGAHRLWLCWLYVRSRRDAVATPLLPSSPSELPLVTVQLPVYNERDVVERLVDAVAALRWPAEKLHIQLLDDSTDDTAARAGLALARAQAKGIACEVLHRNVREGYKAGALAEGLRRTEAELVAIFDADFLPGPDFLERLVPHFQDPSVGMVQARWGHLNADKNALTGAQALLLDGHFVVEHTARHRAGLWTHFNGTAGMWRKSCIVAAGGWQKDTLTEDLDLSYRAELSGWRFVYLPDVVAPAELPETLRAVRTQQQRWAKGSIETFRKLALRVLKAPFPWRLRAEALAHLSSNFAWPLALLLALVMPAMVLTRPRDTVLSHLLLDLPAFVFSTSANLLYYGLAGSQPGKRKLRRIPGAMLLGIGLAAGQARAVWEGVTGQRSAFTRTPKNGGKVGSYKATGDGPVWLELGIAAWHASVAFWAAKSGYWGAVPFLLLFTLGFGWVGTEGLRARLIAGRQRRQKAHVRAVVEGMAEAWTTPG